MLLVVANQEIVAYSLSGDRITQVWRTGPVQVNEITDVGEHTYAVVQTVVAAGPNGGPVRVVDTVTGEAVAEPVGGNWVRLGRDGFVVEITDDTGVREAIEAYGYDGVQRWRFDLAPRAAGFVPRRRRDGRRGVRHGGADVDAHVPELTKSSFCLLRTARGVIRSRQFGDLDELGLVVANTVAVAAHLSVAGHRARRHDGHAGLVVMTLDVDLRQDAIEPLRDPPVAVAEQLHRRRDEQHADHGGVDEHGDGQAEAEQLQLPVVAEHEGQEHAHHDQRRGGDDASRDRQAVGDGGGVVLGVVVLAP